MASAWAKCGCDESRKVEQKNMNPTSNSPGSVKHTLFTA